MKTQQELAERWLFRMERKLLSCLCWENTRLTISVSFRTMFTVLSLPMCLTTWSCDGSTLPSRATSSELTVRLPRGAINCQPQLLSVRNIGEHVGSHVAMPSNGRRDQYSPQEEALTPMLIGLYLVRACAIRPK